MTGISGPMLFLRYAWPCADDLLRAEKITQDDHAKLKWWVENKIKPDVSVLERCFLKAVEKMDGFRQSIGFVCDRWNRYVVEKYWRHYHGGTGDCAVRFGEVVHIFNNESGLVKIAEGDFCIICSNPYNPDLRVDDYISFHKLTVIEKL